MSRPLVGRERWAAEYEELPVETRLAHQRLVLKRAESKIKQYEWELKRYELRGWARAGLIEETRRREQALKTIALYEQEQLNAGFKAEGTAGTRTRPA